MTNYKDYKLCSDLPPLPAGSSEEHYKVKHVLLWATLTFFAHAGAFFGCFFGIRGPGGKWPEAWWSFCFLGNAFIQFWFYLSSNPATIVRRSDSFEFLNWFGKTIGEPGPFACYEAVAITQNNHGAILRTDEHMMNMKKEHSWCACCIGKQMTFCFQDMDKFAQDHGMSLTGGNAVSVPKKDIEAGK